MKRIKTYSNAQFGIGRLPERTPWNIVKARMWLVWFGLRMWLARKKLFVRKIDLND